MNKLAGAELCQAQKLYQLLPSWKSTRLGLPTYDFGATYPVAWSQLPNSWDLVVGGIEIKATQPSWGWKLGLSFAKAVQM